MSRKPENGSQLKPTFEQYKSGQRSHFEIAKSCFDSQHVLCRQIKYVSNPNILLNKKTLL